MEDNQQELMYKLQMYEQHMQQLQQQLQAVEQGIVDLGKLSLGLDDLVGQKDKETMSLIGKGIYIRTKLLSEDLVVDVGGKKFVTKSISETKEMISEQIEKLEGAKEELNRAMEQVGEDFQKMIMEAQHGSHAGEEEDKCGCGHDHSEEHECCGGKDEDCQCKHGEKKNNE